MNTEEKISYLESKLRNLGCPESEVTPYALMALRECEKRNVCVSEIELLNL